MKVVIDCVPDGRIDSQVSGNSGDCDSSGCGGCVDERMGNLMDGLTVR